MGQLGATMGVNGCRPMQTGISEGSQKGSQKIIAAIAGRPNITIEEIAKSVGISTRAVKKHLSALKAGGFVKRIGPDRGGHWVVLRSEKS